ncbi:MAG: hypothetical protein ACI9XO_003119 [Paraglaciecola sp.]|jgi:hypothetical protein
MKRTLLFLLLVMPIANFPMLCAEASLSGKSTFLTVFEVEEKAESSKRRTKRNTVKKQRKRAKLFQKMQNWFSITSDEAATAKVFFLGLGGAILMLLGILSVTGTLMIIGFILSLMATISSIAELSNGNSHWAVVTGMILGILAVLAPLGLVFYYLANIEP